MANLEQADEIGLRLKGIGAQALRNPDGERPATDAADMGRPEAALHKEAILPTPICAKKPVLERLGCMAKLGH